MPAPSEHRQAGSPGTEKSLRLTTLPEGHPCGRCAVRAATICGTLKAKELGHFKSLSSSGYAEPSQCLFHEGDPAQLVYSITSGSLKLYRLLPDGRRQIAAFPQAGDFLGLTLEKVHAYTAEALEPVEYCRFPRQRFDAFVDEHPEMGRELYLMAAHELAAAREQMVLLGRKTARERLASFLLTLFDRARCRNADWEIVRLPMTRTDIADHLGLTKETVSRTFTSLRRTEMIALLPGERVELLQRRRLEQLACGELG
ncbi:Crp/Fnr family transcriptional regulator [Sphingosinicella rhizophila]|uniref:Helix-turn-helix domain-containing protein n=1 Tax=Sphingosinicella rhizophila TaxID=3050082 RepID=A0ABU3Q925_9SPHN|nr:cyclic nucleotide-binding domain-containing protein [Sphingosinicella sp. GR2756]MDT9599904.1 helix-turn-helix domain-containing protein [Sphingosinicella sp. GR2756]